MSRIRAKRLRGMSRPRHRFGVDEIRAFYDVSGANVDVLVISRGIVTPGLKLKPLDRRPVPETEHETAELPPTEHAATLSSVVLYGPAGCPFHWTARREP